MFELGDAIVIVGFLFAACWWKRGIVSIDIGGVRNISYCNEGLARASAE